MVLIAVRGPAVGKLGLIAYIYAIALYALIGILAIAPRIIGGLGVTPVRVEAVLLTILVFTGVNVAWLLLFEAAQPGSPSLEHPLCRLFSAADALRTARMTHIRRRTSRLVPEKPGKDAARR